MYKILFCNSAPEFVCNRLKKKTQCPTQFLLTFSLWNTVCQTRLWDPRLLVSWPHRWCWYHLCMDECSPVQQVGSCCVHYCCPLLRLPALWCTTQGTWRQSIRQNRNSPYRKHTTFRIGHMNLMAPKNNNPPLLLYSNPNLLVIVHSFVRPPVLCRSSVYSVCSFVQSFVRSFVNSIRIDNEKIRLL